MNEFEVVKHIMMLDHISYDDLSARMGYKSSATSYNRLNGKHIYTDTLRKFLDELGYDMVIRRKDGTGNEYIVNDDTTPSPLRFHDMRLNLDAVYEGRERCTIKLPLTMADRRAKSEALKQRIGEITLSECIQELCEIWEIKEHQSYCEYTPEYERYVREFEELYRR